MKSFTAYTITAEHAGLSVETYLKQVLQLSGRKLQKLTRQKGIRLGNKPTFLTRLLKNGDILRILTLEDSGYGVEPESGAVSILFEDEDVLVIDKPPYQLVHPAGRTTHGTVANYLAFELSRRGILCTIRPLHRLDRDTSGCLLFAKNAQSQTRLEEQLKERRLKRSYQALVELAPQPSDGTIDAAIGEHPSQPNRRAVTPKGDSAVTHYRTRQSYNNGALLELELDTGRTHQIRVHLAHIGSPLLGDGMYGKRSPLLSRQALHAYRIRFFQPSSGEEICVEAPLPNDFLRAISALEKGSM